MSPPEGTLRVAMETTLRSPLSGAWPAAVAALPAALS
jgi:hypothetical protein